MTSIAWIPPSWEQLFHPKKLGWHSLLGAAFLFVLYTLGCVLGGLLYSLVEIFKIGGFIGRTITSGDEPRSARRRSSSPPPLGPRERALTVSSTREGGSLVSSDYLQYQCPLFNKLPPEIRRMIYRAVLVPPGGAELRISHAYRRLYSLPYLTDKEGILPGRIIVWRPTRSEVVSSRNRSAGLLCSCRRIYSEAIDILYTDNTFNIRWPRTILHLQSTILPQRLRTIRSLHLEMVLDVSWVEPFTPHNSEGVRKWETTWTIIGMMRGLQKLCVDLSHAESAPSERAVVYALGCMISFRVREFAVRFCWPVRVEKVLEGLGWEAPFKIIVTDSLDYLD